MTKEERLEKEIVRQEKSMERLNQSIMRIEASQKRLQAENKKKIRSLDAHNKIVMGGVVRSVLGRDFEEGDDRRLLYFLRRQERNGNYFTRAMNRRGPSEKETIAKTKLIVFPSREDC